MAKKATVTMRRKPGPAVALTPVAYLREPLYQPPLNSSGKILSKLESHRSRSHRPR